MMGWASRIPCPHAEADSSSHLEIEGLERGPAPIRHGYFHIPFCPKICPYCSFYKEASDRNKTPQFLEALLAEVRQWTGRMQVHTLFFGGGTPTALTFKQLEFLLAGLREILDLSSLTEWTFEMNPATVSLEKARLLRESGVNRVSMGVQAWQPELLAVLGRVHSAEQARRSYDILREAGFENINLDHIFGIPGQSLEQWEETLQLSTDLGPEHLSAYCLTYEEDTPFFAARQAGVMREDEDLEVRLFDRTREFLGERGYAAYEISNFCRPGRSCRHNVAYWRGADYVGFGPSAFSTVEGRRWRNVADTVAYTQGILNGGKPTEHYEVLDRVTQHNERLAFGLRMAEGVPRAWVEEEKLTPLLTAGLLRVLGASEIQTELRSETIALTPAGLRVADAVAAELLS